MIIGAVLAYSSANQIMLVSHEVISASYTGPCIMDEVERIERRVRLQDVRTPDFSGANGQHGQGGQASRDFAARRLKGHRRSRKHPRRAPT